MENNLEYYMNIKYKIEIVPIPDEDGGGYFARIPQLGKDAFVGDGETIKEALNNLERIKKVYFEDYLERGINIPEPIIENNVEDCSGKLMLRIPKNLHFKLINNAKRNNSSLNQHLNYLITYATSVEDMKYMLKDEYENVTTAFSRQIKYIFDSASRRKRIGTNQSFESKYMKVA